MSGGRKEMRKPMIFLGALLIAGLMLAALPSIWLYDGGFAARGVAVPTPQGTEIKVPDGGQTPFPAQSPAPDPLTQIKDGTPSPPEGASAITPPVTEAKVRQYIANNTQMSEINAKNIKVDSFEFLSANELNQRLGGNAGLNAGLNGVPADEPFVYVRLSGDFTFYDMDNVEHIFHSAFRVFSARTGNEVMGGALPK
jgi:hypothetical protein